MIISRDTWNEFDSQGGRELPKFGDLQLAPMHRIIKNAGGERVSEAAANELRQVLEDIGLMIAKEALVFMNHARRKTVKDIDIRIAAERTLQKLR